MKACREIPEEIATAPGVILETARRLIGICELVASANRPGVSALMGLLAGELRVIEDEAFGLAAHYARLVGEPPPER